MTDALALDSIAKRFGGVAALAGATMHVRPGTVHALLGENGAGKTTLMRVAFGMLRPDRGTVRVSGRTVAFGSPADALRAGVGMVQQHFALVAAMTVAENVALGGRWRYDAREANARVRALGEQTRLALDPAARVSALPVGAQQRLEIVKALARGARVLILDEPTAVLTPAEAAELLRWVRAFVDAGNAVVLITHKLRDAITTADDVTVIRRGTTVLTCPASDATEDVLAAAMLGEAPGGTPADIGDAMGAATPATRRAPRQVSGADAVLDARAISVADERGATRVRDASLRVSAGEIVGVAAIEGAGQQELLRALAGRLPVTAGALTLPALVGFVPEDRHRDALVLDFPLYENVALREAGARRGLMRWRAMEDEARGLVRDFDVRGGGVRERARVLSGGNQQKLVLARELAGAPPALIVENPTRGLDIRATAAVRARLRAARDAGTAVVLYSSDLDEVLALSDRVAVVHAGSVREVPVEREGVGRAMLGVA